MAANNNIPPNKGQKRAMPVQKPKEMKKTLLRLWHYVSIHKFKLFMVFFFVTFSVLTNLVSTRIVGTAIDKYVLQI